jgi:hypothetical protein
MALGILRDYLPAYATYIRRLNVYLNELRHSSDI